jgi:hypothetical protein
LTFAGPGIQDPPVKTIEQTVNQIDAARESYFEQNPDRPVGHARARSKRPADVVKAESRMRTAAWRKQLDDRRAPESYHVALQFLLSTIDVAREAGLEIEELPETKKAFDHAFDALEARGFNRKEVMAVYKRLTRRAR